MTKRKLKLVNKEPCLEIRRLLKLRGMKQKELAESKGISFFMLSKFLTQMEYETYAGKIKDYQLPHIRKAIAEAINVPYDDLWGPNGKEIIRNLIAEEVIKGKTKKVHDSTRQRWSIKAFLKNLLGLGYVPSNKKR